MSIQKNMNQLKLEMTAHYQEKSKLNIRFWNQDYNTSVLQFLVTRENFPLSLSTENVEVIIVLENGTSYVSSDDLDVSSEIDGVVSYTIPTDFMSVASGTVTGQIFVGTKDQDEVIVSRQSTFEVSNDLLSTIPSELKLQYIKTFSDLRDEISDRVTSLENDLATMEDYVTSVEQATTDGLLALNNLVNAKTVEYNDNHADKLALINTTVDGYVQDFLDQRSYIDTKYAEFQTAVGGSGLVTTGSAATWQKHKLTADNGGHIQLTEIDFNTIDETLKTGFYWVGGGTNRPVNINGFLTVRQGTGSNSYIKVVYEPFNSNVIYVRTKNASSGWSDWAEVAIQNSNNPFETVGGSSAKANVVENNAKAYTNSKVDEQHNILFSGSVNGVGQTVNLTGNMNDYEYIIISGDCSGNDFSQIMVPSIIGTIFNMQNLNLRDSDGMFLGAYECRLETTSTTIKITNDVAYDNPSDTGSGPNRNAYTITRVEGVHKK